MERLDSCCVAVYKNTRRVHDAICVYQAYVDLYDNITKNGKRSALFWQLVVRHASTEMIAGLSRLYDRTSSRNKKHTVYELYKLVNKSTYASVVSFAKTKSYNIIEAQPEILDSNLEEELKKILDYRDKKLAHEDCENFRLETVGLPPIEMFIALKEKAEEIVGLAYDPLGPGWQKNDESKAYAVTNEAIKFWIAQREINKFI